MNPAELRVFFQAIFFCPCRAVYPGFSSPLVLWNGLLLFHEFLFHECSKIFGLLVFFRCSGLDSSLFQMFKVTDML